MAELGEGPPATPKPGPSLLPNPPSTQPSQSQPFRMPITQPPPNPMVSFLFTKIIL